MADIRLISSFKSHIKFCIRLKPKSSTSLTIGPSLKKAILGFDMHPQFQSIWVFASDIYCSEIYKMVIPCSDGIDQQPHLHYLHPESLTTQLKNK